MPKNAIKREGRVNFWKNIDYKKPETRPEPVMSNPNPTRTRRNISKPDPTRTRKKFQNPNPTRTRHLATRPITTLTKQISFLLTTISLDAILCTMQILDKSKLIQICTMQRTYYRNLFALPTQRKIYIQLQLF